MSLEHVDEFLVFGDLELVVFVDKEGLDPVLVEAEEPSQELSIPLFLIYDLGS